MAVELVAGEGRTRQAGSGGGEGFRQQKQRTDVAVPGEETPLGLDKPSLMEIIFVVDFTPLSNRVLCLVKLLLPGDGWFSRWNGVAWMQAVDWSRMKKLCTAGAEGRQGQQIKRQDTILK